MHLAKGRRRFEHHRRSHVLLRDSDADPETLGLRCSARDLTLPTKRQFSARALDCMIFDASASSAIVHYRSLEELDGHAAWWNAFAWRSG